MSAQSPRPTDSEGMTRRGLFRRGGAAAGGLALALGGSSAVPRFSPVSRAQAVAPVAVVGVIGGAAAVKYVTGETVGEHLFTGDDRDYSAYIGADALHQEIAVGAAEMQSADERVMTGIVNNVTHSDTVALAKGKAAVVEAMNAEKSESDAQTALEDTINGHFATIEENIIKHNNSQVSQLEHMHTRVGSHDNLSVGDVFTPNDGHDIRDVEWSVIESAHTLLNGDEMNLKGLDYTYERVSDSSTWFPEIQMLSESGQLFVNDPDGDMILAYDTTNYSNANADPDETANGPYNRLLYRRDMVLGDLSGFVSDVYSQYQPGDIPTEDLVDPITAATELRQNYDNASGQSAHAAMLGIPTTANLSATLEIQSDEASDGKWDVEADIFTDHVPTDSDGNETGFETGSTYQPSQWDEPLYIAYNYVDELSGEEKGAFTQIESEFTIVSVTDSDGNDVDNFKPESRNNQTADVSALKEELEQLREQQLKMQEEAEEKTDGGGGGGDWIPDASEAGPLVGAFLFVMGILGVGKILNS